jgi:hypothetical protein
VRCAVLKVGRHLEKCLRQDGCQYWASIHVVLDQVSSGGYMHWCCGIEPWRRTSSLPQSCVVGEGNAPWHNRELSILSESPMKSKPIGGLLIHDPRYGPIDKRNLCAFVVDLPGTDRLTGNGFILASDVKSRRETKDGNKSLPNHTNSCAGQTVTTGQPRACISTGCTPPTTHHTVKPPRPPPLETTCDCDHDEVGITEEAI